MCAIFGILDYKGQLDHALRVQIIKELGTAAETRGTDATGIAYFQRDRLCIQKAPKAAHKMKYRISAQAQYIMGHTRMTTQGSAMKNQNNHPFSGKAGSTQFALAHNGVLHNDRELQKKYHLPRTSIETDSYIAVQLIERQREVSFDSLRQMAETIEGSFTFTILTQDNSMYFIKGDNPLTIYHYPDLGIYIYASTEEILQVALGDIALDTKQEIIQPWPREILRIDSSSNQESVHFLMADPFWDWGSPWEHQQKHITQQEYLQAVKVVAAFHGYEETYIDALLEDGYTTDDIETMIYCGR